MSVKFALRSVSIFNHSYQTLWHTKLLSKSFNCSKKIYPNINFITDICDTRRFIQTTCITYKKKKVKNLEQNISQESQEDLDEEILFDPEFESLRSTTDILGETSGGINEQGVVVLQPWVKWGPRMRQNTSPELLLDEAVALVETLPGFKVRHKEVVPVRSLDTKAVFGSGQLERLHTKVKQVGASVVFTSLDILKRAQIGQLEESLGCKILDRYSTVLSIFRHRAKTTEARLQVALAELPYIRSRAPGPHEKAMVDIREKKLRLALSRLGGQRELLRKNRNKSGIPSVAVVGYTNAGKTTLIHSLTGDSRAEGHDQLFATLDVTVHGGPLPCGLSVVFVDTVGFIQDIPTNLVASFKATLEDAILADVVIHVCDVSHPAHENQAATVANTLASLPLLPDTPVITIANKIDLCPPDMQEQLGDVLAVSATTGQGLQNLLELVESEVLRVTDRKTYKFQLPTGSDEIRWLRGFVGLATEEMDVSNPQVTHVTAVLTPQQLAQFTNYCRLR